MPGFVSVHLGAGYHSEKYRQQYLNLCNKACLKGVEVLRSGGDSLEAACVVTSVAEDSEITNAGIGSNLTWDGDVECDASVMNSLGTYGAVGAVRAVRNPVMLAKEICLARMKPLSLDRVPPCLLVGDGALRWASSRNMVTLDPKLMITDKAKRQQAKYKNKVLLANTENQTEVVSRLDTVGAVCVDLDGSLSAAASSGGVLLKVAGRVGQAAQYGAGVWAQHYRYGGEGDSSAGLRGGVAVASSGTGEQLIATLLARSVAVPLLESSSPAMDLHCAIKKHFIDSPFLTSEKKKLCGVIAVKTEDDSDRGELLWAHSTLTMALGYMSTDMKKPKSVISSLEPGKVGCEPIIGGAVW